uniref:oxaloacetate tautomerase n=1 Tax=Ditylenchus dipsaci TaxID=166011 RepID=A0A915E6B6_9BILA
MSQLKNFRSLGKKIVCIGRNYREHAAELNNPVPSKPLLFSKTTNSYLAEGEGKIQTPFGCKNLHFEVELGVIISKRAKQISQDNAFDYIGGYTIALDMTARDWQDELKKQGHPWFISKSYDSSCPVGEFVSKEKIKQQGMTSDMIFSIPVMLEYITKFVTLEVGDLVLTGTPAGVGPCKSGDKLDIGITDVTSAQFEVE